MGAGYINSFLNNLPALLGDAHLQTTLQMIFPHESTHFIEARNRLNATFLNWIGYNGPIK